ncbi:MAG: hypothetical protein P8L16_09080, partial [Ilumatobacter sp.]|nr:hypothetical protein [Ilumatobacter sp.]
MFPRATTDSAYLLELFGVMLDVNSSRRVESATIHQLLQRVLAERLEHAVLAHGSGGVGHQEALVDERGERVVHVDATDSYLFTHRLGGAEIEVGHEDSETGEHGA